MPAASDKKDETRRRIIESARRLFNRSGLNDATIEQIMADAGLTRGGFYKHFDSKDELYAEAVRAFGRNPMHEKWQQRHIDPTARGRELGAMIAEAYLSSDHLEDQEGSCPMIGLPTDVARSSAVVQEAFRDVLNMMVEVFACGLDGDAPARRGQAMALTAMCVGGMVLARAVNDKGLAEELRHSVRREVFALAGWRSGDEI